MPLVLRSDDLLSKWGFNDGDVPDDAPEEFWEHSDEWHDILRLCVRRYLLPAIGQDVDVYDIETIHNPIRAEGHESIPSVTVEVPWDKVRRLVDEAQEGIWTNRESK